jgi:hypothetical protein
MAKQFVTLKERASKMETSTDYKRAERKLWDIDCVPHAFSKTEQRLARIFKKAFLSSEDKVEMVMEVAIDMNGNGDTIGTETPNGTYFPLDHDPYWDEILTDLESKIK